MWKALNRGNEYSYLAAPRNKAKRSTKKNGETKKGREGRRRARRRETRIRRSAKTKRAIHTKIWRDTRLARTIPARKASENHTSGSRVVSCSCMRLRGGVSAACIDVFHHSIEF